MRGLTGFALGVGQAASDAAVGWLLADRGQARPLSGGLGALRFSGAARGPSNAGVAEDADRVVVLAGEIYRRDGLHACLDEAISQETSDAEIVSALFREYGPAAPRLLNGRLAGVVIEADRIVVFTDHAGTVPLYFAPHRGGLAISTEAKALVRGARAGDGIRELSELQEGLLPGGTPFVGVSRVPNGSCLIIGSDGVLRASERHFAFPVHRSAPPTEEAGRTQILELLRLAVVERLGPERRVASVLSGGVDSSIVTALALEAGAEVSTYTLGTEGADEFAEARLVADALGTAHHEIRVAEDDLVAALPHAVWAAEVSDARFIEYLLPLHCVLAQVRGVHRVLTGYGADIVLGGMLDHAMSSGRREEAITADLASTEGSNEFTPVIGTPHGVWTTHPFWDRDVLTYVTGVPAAIKGREGIEKHFLRSAVAGLIPTEAAWRPKLGIHQSTGLVNGFDRLLTAQGMKGDIDLAKQVVVHRLLKILYEDGANPDEIDIADAISGVAA